MLFRPIGDAEPIRIPIPFNFRYVDVPLLARRPRSITKQDENQRDSVESEAWQAYAWRSDAYRPLAEAEAYLESVRRGEADGAEDRPVRFVLHRRPQHERRRQSGIFIDHGDLELVVWLATECVAEGQAEHEDEHERHEQQDDRRARIAQEQPQIFEGDGERGHRRFPEAKSR